MESRKSRFKTFEQLLHYWKDARGESPVADAICFLAERLLTTSKVAGLTWDWDTLDKHKEK